MIDGDHYFWYALEMREWIPTKAIKWYKKSIPKWFNLPIKEREKFKRGVFICHRFLFWVILILLSFIHKFFLWVLIGVAIHMVADIIDLYIKDESLYNKIFPLYVIKRNKNKKEPKDL